MDKPKRKPTRLREYNYATPGAYFVTICSYQRAEIFGEVVGQGLAPAVQQNTANIPAGASPCPTVEDGQNVATTKLSRCGEIAEEQLLKLQERYDNIKIPHYVIMPDHIHALVVIEAKAAGVNPCPTLSDVFCAYKSLTTRECKKENSEIYKVFQTSFNDRIIRNETEYIEKCKYIENNPLKWFLRKETEQ